jgi:hypothetical protein
VSRLSKPWAYLTRVFTECGVCNATRVRPSNNRPTTDLRQPFRNYLYKISNLGRHRNKVQTYPVGGVEIVCFSVNLLLRFTVLCKLVGKIGKYSNKDTTKIFICLIV